MRIGKISAFGAAVPLLVFTLGCCGTVCPQPATSPCDPRPPIGQFGFMPVLPQPQSPECPPTNRFSAGPALTHRLGGDMAANTSAVKVMGVPSNKYSTRFCLPSRSQTQAPARTRASTRPVVYSAPAPAVTSTPVPARSYSGTGDQPVTADITVQYPLPVPMGNLCSPGDGLGECYTLPEGSSPASDGGVELYVPGVVSPDTSAASTTSEAKVEEAVVVAETAVVEEVVAPIGEAVEVAETVEAAVVVTPEQAADASVTGSIARADDVDATVTLVRPEVEAPARPAEVEVAAPAAPVPMPAPFEDKLAEKAGSDTLAVETAPIDTAEAPAMPSAMEGLEDRAYLAMPRLPSEMSRDRAIVEDRLNTKVDLDGVRAKEDDTGIPMVELPPKLD